MSRPTRPDSYLLQRVVTDAGGLCSGTYEGHFKYNYTNMSLTV